MILFYAVDGIFAVNVGKRLENNIILGAVLNIVIDAINRIKERRFWVIPPYAYDWDEDEKSVEDYVDYYRRNIDCCICDAMAYRNSLFEFENVLSEESLSVVLDMRKRFISTFPFCDDKFDLYEDIGSDRCNSLYLQMRNSYYEFAGDDSISHIDRYIDNLVCIKEYMQDNP
ncbi:hypothetical protein HCH_01971 [Hahella chejuensis KCTC 2396]|uniref:Uncharacterized protein n=1 Tax=Hahella chejuensis (strain KCTC 2396) TaxID=349521 RepID=Q2SKM0_HAHCH|nr:hypothetical protein [Hahella chejuensis]ABC28804.1 hypothetical protein HCH_01971 [Hahella chejuensis KCTC 2396]